MNETDSGTVPKQCFYCPKPDPDCCIRMTAIAAGGRPRPVFAHAACAADHGIKPLYFLTGQPRATVVAFPWA